MFRGGICSVCKREEHLLMNVTIVDRLCFKNCQALLELRIPKIRISGSYYLKAFRCRNSKTVSQLNFEGLFGYGLLLQRLL